MKNTNLKNILTILCLFFFISSGILANTNTFKNCIDSCCETECCDEIEFNNMPLESSCSPENNCCDISEGLQSNTENPIIFISQSKINSLIIFNHTNNISIIESNKIYLLEHSLNTPKIHNFIPALRI